MVRRSVPSRSAFGRRSRSRSGVRILLAIGMAIFSLLSYFGSKQFNAVTGKEQYISLTQEQEIALGLQSVPHMVQQHNGLEESSEIQQFVDEIGERLVTQSDAAQTDWAFSFTMLDDSQTVNAFALPGGPTFMTMALYERLSTEGQVAGVFAHEIGHVVARHSAERLAQQNLTQGLAGAAVLATYDPENPNSRQSAQTALMIGNLVNMKFGRDDELEADRLGVRFMAQAGYDPRALIEVMRVLEAAGGGGGQPEFFSTHPNPANRIAEIEAAIRAEFPNGVPDDLIK